MCFIVAKVEAARRGGQETVGGVFGAVCVCALSNNRVGGLHVERKAAIKPGDSSGSGTVFYSLPPPLKNRAKVHKL